MNWQIVRSTKICYDCKQPLWVLLAVAVCKAEQLMASKHPPDTIRVHCLTPGCDGEHRAIFVSVLTIPAVEGVLNASA